MHTLLGISTILVAMGAGWAALHLARHLAGAPRRQILMAVLAAPVLGLVVNAGALWHLAGRVCFLGAPPWDDVLGSALPLSMGLVGLGGLALVVLRSVLLRRLVARGTAPGDDVAASVERLAAAIGVPRPRLRVLASSRPLAFTCGVRRPTVVVSTGIFRALDDREREAVLAHELAHARRRDYLWLWVATALRDAFFYLPTSRLARQRLQEESELACDDLAVATTERPLALAGALAKVWGAATEPRPMPAVAPGIAESGPQIEVRIRRLLDGGSPAAAAGRPTCDLPVVIGGTLVALAGLPLVSALLLFAPMGCGPFVRVLG